jgi:hypothetical protein
LQDVAEWGAGGTPSRRTPHFYRGSIPWIKTGELGRKYIGDSEEYITEEAVRRSSAKVFPAGSVGIAMYGATIGKLSIWEVDASTNQACAVAQVHNGLLNNEFLYYYLLSEKRSLIRSGKGGAQPNISQGLLKEWPIRVPPLNEQHRIVAKIEALFSELDKGIEALKTAREQLKVYREVVLEDALRAGGDSTGSSCLLSDVIGDISQGWSPKCELNRPPRKGEWAVIKTSAILPMQYVSEECKPLPDSLEPRPQLEVKSGDFLMTRKGPRRRTGVVCLVRETRERLMLCDTVYRFRCDERKIYPDYLEMVLNSPSVVRELDRRKSGISDSGISLNHGKVKSVPIPLVGAVDEQKRLVGSVHRKLEATVRAETEIELNLARVETLRQSILKKAFSGQLVPQVPNDEPAAVLLERIRAGKAAQAKPVKDNRRKLSA